MSGRDSDPTMKNTDKPGNSSKLSKFVQNFGFLTGGKVLGDLCTFLLFVALSRIYGKEGIGQYSFAIAFTGFFAVLAEFGSYHFSIKELSRVKKGVEKDISNIFFMRIVFSVIGSSLLLLMLPFLPFSRDTKNVILIIGLFQIVYKLVDGFGAAFVAREDTHLAGLLEFSMRFITAAGVIILALAGCRLIIALSAMPVVVSAHFLLSYYLICRKYGRLNFLGGIQNFSQMVKGAFQFAVSEFLYQLYSRLDVVFLGFFIGTETSGLYNVAYRILFLLQFLPYYIGLAVFPETSRLYLSSKTDLKKLYNQSLRLVVLIFLPLAAGLWLTAPEIIHLFFGPEFDFSASILRVLSVLLILFAINHMLSVFLMSCEMQYLRTRCQWVAVSINIFGNLILIPIYGIYGAAAATLAAESTLVFLLLRYIRKVLGYPKIWNRLCFSVLGSSVFLTLFLVFPHRPLWIVVPASGLIYLAVISLSASVRQSEIQMAKALIKDFVGWSSI